jgi:hypothetical protein
MKSIKKFTICSIVFVFTAILSSNVMAQNTDGGHTGLGVMLGEPTGISLKSWNNSRTAFDLGLAWSLSGKDAVHIHGDHLWHKWLDVENGNLAFYYGIGARAVFSDDTYFGARIPFGLNYLIEDSPVGLFFEVAPIVDFLPDTDGDANGGIGIRYYF